MGHSMGTLDFFLLEGGEYLERLDALAQAPAGSFSQGEDLVRTARAFRGSAIMASQHGLARAAQGIESCTRAVREGRLPWSEAIRAELVRAIDDCKILMRRLRAPEQGDTERAEGIGIQLDRMSGRASAAIRATTGPGLDAGARAFVAREAASIASVLQRCAQTLRVDPANREVLGGVPAAMSALRGVAVINDLPPLGDVLAAIEHAGKHVLAAGGTMGTEAVDVFEAGARALARAAREVVDAGRPDAESPEARAFAAQLLAVLPARGRIVAVETLFYDDAGPHIVQQGTPPAGGAALARVEMVSHGEYLSAAAAELGRAASPVQRDLRLFGIAASVRPMMGAAGSPLAVALGRVAEAVRDAIARGAASVATEKFIRHIREAADALAAAQSGDERLLADRLAHVTAGLDVLAATAAAPAEPDTAPSMAATMAAPPPEPASKPVEAPTAAAALGEADLATSYLTLEELIADGGPPLGGLDELIAGGTLLPVRGRTTGPRAAAAMAPAGPAAAFTPAEPPIVPVESLAPDETDVVPVESLAPDETDVVPIESLLFRGDAALHRVLELKGDLLAAARAGDGGDRLNDLLREVFDLVQLGLGSAR
jgi:hypothetical protein